MRQSCPGWLDGLHAYTTLCIGDRSWGIRDLKLHPSCTHRFHFKLNRSVCESCSVLRSHVNVGGLHVQQQAQDFEMWADKQASKLQAEQQNMRERANKQWAEIDSMHEERLQNRRNGPPSGPRAPWGAMLLNLMSLQDHWGPC